MILNNRDGIKISFPPLKIRHLFANERTWGNQGNSVTW